MTHNSYNELYGLPQREAFKDKKYLLEVYYDARKELVPFDSKEELREASELKLKGLTRAIIYAKRKPSLRSELDREGRYELPCDTYATNKRFVRELRGILRGRPQSGASVTQQLSRSSGLKEDKIGFVFPCLVEGRLGISQEGKESISYHSFQFISQLPVASLGSGKLEFIPMERVISRAREVGANLIANNSLKKGKESLYFLLKVDEKSPLVEKFGLEALVKSLQSKVQLKS